MTAFKIIGSVLIILSGCFLSRKMIRSDDAAVQRLVAFSELLTSIRSRIENYCMPTDEILKDLPHELLIRCGYKPTAIPESMEQMLSECPFSNDAEIGGLLLKFFSSLGTSYKAEEVARCRLACDELAVIIRRRNDENLKRRKTVPALGFCLSLVIVIIAF